MKRTTNENVLRAFLKGENAISYNGNLFVCGHKLVNYYTTIAYLEYDILWINLKKYSRTTTTITNKLISIIVNERNAVINHTTDSTITYQLLK